MTTTPRNRQAASTAATNIAGTTETVLATSPPLSADGQSQTVIVDATAGFTVGTGQTTCTVRVRRGTGITGTVVNSIAGVTIVAGNTVSIPIQAVDSPGEVADQQYVVTVQQAGGAGNGTNVLSTIAASISS